MPSLDFSRSFTACGFAFTPDDFITCDACKGKRHNAGSVQAKSAADMLDMTVEGRSNSSRRCCPCANVKHSYTGQF
jgi:hypothetical protein